MKGNMWRHGHRRLGIVVACSALLAMASIAVEPSPRASGATTAVLTTAPTAVELAKTVAVQKYSTASTAVIVQNSSGAIHVGSNLAGRRRLPLLIGTSGTSAADVAPQLAIWGVTKVYLVGRTADYFTSQYIQELSARGVSVENYIQDPDGFELWRKAAEPTGSGEYVLARSDDPTAYRLATSYAASRGAALVIWQTTTAPSLMRNFFSQVEGADIVFVANPKIVPYDQITEPQSGLLTVISTSNARQGMVLSAARLQAIAGPAINDVVVAPIDSIIDLALAGIRARDRNGIALPAGTKAAITTDSRANEYLRLWRNGTGRVELLGVGVTSTQLTTVAAPSKLVPAAPPPFRALGLNRNDADGSYTLTVSRISGATNYVAFDKLRRDLPVDCGCSQVRWRGSAGIPCGERPRLDEQVDRGVQL